jgi:polo-like kinase 1
LGHSYEVDVWSLGVVVYTLLYGRPPFETSDVKKTYKRIRECQYTFNEDVPVSANAKNLISRLLVVDPSKRLTLAEVLLHPFMTGSRIPKQLPSSVLTQPLPRSIADQYTVNPQAISSCKHNPSAKTIESSKGE